MENWVQEYLVHPYSVEDDKGGGKKGHDKKI